MVRFAKGISSRRSRRETVGIALIAFTLSSVVTVLMAGEKAPRRVEVVENLHPAEIRMDQWNTFSTVVIARKSVECLVLEFNCLHEVRPEEKAEGSGKLGREAMLCFQPVSELLAMARRLGLDPVEFETHLEINRTKHYVHVMDFSSILRGCAGDDVLGDYFGYGATTVYAGISNETGLVLLYGGCKDYFHIRNVSITEMSLSLNDEKHTYKRARDLSPSERSARIPTILDAPGMGTLRFWDLGKDDTVRLVFSVDSSASPYSSYLQVIRVFANGEVEEEIANFFPKGQ